MFRTNKLNDEDSKFIQDWWDKLQAEIQERKNLPGISQNEWLKTKKMNEVEIEQRLFKNILKDIKCLLSSASSKSDEKLNYYLICILYLSHELENLDISRNFAEQINLYLKNDKLINYYEKIKKLIKEEGKNFDINKIKEIIRSEPNLCFFNTIIISDNFTHEIINCLNKMNLSKTAQLIEVKNDYQQEISSLPKETQIHLITDLVNLMIKEFKNYQNSSRRNCIGKLFACAPVHSDKVKIWDKEIKEIFNSQTKSYENKIKEVELTLNKMQDYLKSKKSVRLLEKIKALRQDHENRISDFFKYPTKK